MMERWWKRSKISENEKGGRNIQMKKPSYRAFLSDPRDLNPLIYLIISMFMFFDGKHFMF